LIPFIWSIYRNFIGITIFTLTSRGAGDYGYHLNIMLIARPRLLTAARCPGGLVAR